MVNKFKKIFKKISQSNLKSFSLKLKKIFKKKIDKNNFKEIHFVYGALAARKFVYPISKSLKNKSKIFYQPANKADIFQSSNAQKLPNWVNTKISFSWKIFLILPSLFYLSYLILKYKKSTIIVHTTTYATVPLFLTFIFRIENRIYFNHGFANIGSKGIIKIVLYFLEILNVLLSTKVITVSPSHLKFLKKNIISKLAPIKSTTPGSCCGILKSKIIDQKILNAKINKLKNKNSNLTITYIGRPHNRKGYPLILNIFKNIVELYPIQRFSLQIIGINPELVKKEIRDLPFKDSIKTIGYTNNVFKYLRNSHIIILPSQREGFGYALLEGAACGNALICFDIVGPDSLIKNNFNGLTIEKNKDAFDFAKNVVELIKDKNKLIKMIINAREASFEFEQKKVIKSVREILKIN